MAHDALSLSETEYAANIQRNTTSAPLNASYELILLPRVEMLVGPWYLDEFGNQTRQIKQRV
jgi:hypothetical protein